MNLPKKLIRLTGPKSVPKKVVRMLEDAINNDPVARAEIEEAGDEVAKTLAGAFLRGEGEFRS